MIRTAGSSIRNKRPNRAILSRLKTLAGRKHFSLQPSDFPALWERWPPTLLQSLGEGDTAFVWSVQKRGHRSPAITNESQGRKLIVPHGNGESGRNF
jgi:hypothetical protein